jgi:hemerythrin-like domain-containing protein
MSKAIDELVNDHEAILSALAILERMAAASTPVDSRDKLEFIDFLKEFADTCHHGKEEGFLFPSMIAMGVRDQGGPIGVMMSEHELGRDLLRRMSHSLSPQGNPAEFSQAAQDYIRLLRAHIQKENTVLFPLAERALSQDNLASLAEHFEQHEEQVIGHGRHEELHHLLDRLRAKYLP